MGCGSSKKVPPIETGAQEKPVAPPLEQEKPVAPPPEQEKPVAPPPEQEKPVAPPPPPLSLRIVPSPTPPPGQKASSKAAPPDFSPLIKQNLVLPDELEGPYVLSKYHKNWRGRGRGFFEEAGEDKWGDSNREKMKKWESWGSIDWDHPDAPDPDFALESGSVGGKGLNIKELRPSIIAAQREMVQVYTAAFERAVAKPGAAAAFEKITQLEERRNKERQPGGRDLDIFGLFKGALGAIGELWAYGLEVREASGEHDAGLSWGIKKAHRIWFKLATKYDGDISCVTDCARISLEFKTMEGLLAAAEKLLGRASTFKNRVANRTDEGYADLMFTLPMSNGHICEVQLHLAEMMEAKKSGAGHRKYKLCRRILGNPIVEEDTYCREIKDGKPHGDGERNAAGEREGYGVLVMASGNMHEGQWRAGMQEGVGTMHWATGDKYVGQWADGRREGQGTLHYPNGNKYEGEWVASQKEGQATYYNAAGETYEGEYVAGRKQGKGTHYYASGSKYVGQWAADKKEGQGTMHSTNDDGNTYDVYEGEWVAGKKEGKGTYHYASGNKYEGEFVADRREGKGTLHWATGHVEVDRYKADAVVGEGARWSADRATAWRMSGGKTSLMPISLEEAARIAEQVGLPVPGASSQSPLAC